MKDVATTKLSSRGQVVIPEDVRRRLGLEPGAQFVVIGEGDTILLRRIRPPSLEDFDALLARARSAAAEAGLREEDLSATIQRVRRRG